MGDWVWWVARAASGAWVLVNGVIGLLEILIGLVGNAILLFIRVHRWNRHSPLPMIGRFINYCSSCGRRGRKKGRRKPNHRMSTVNLIHWPKCKRWNKKTNNDWFSSWSVFWFFTIICRPLLAVLRRLTDSNLIAFSAKIEPFWWWEYIVFLSGIFPATRSPTL